MSLKSPPTPLSTSHLSRTYAIIAAMAVVLIWSGWIVLSRSGVQGNFSIWDLGLLRFGTAACLVLPYMLLRGPSVKFLFAPRIALPALAGGSVYVLLSFAALRQSPATNAGIVVNGLIPLATLVLLFVMTSRKPTIFDFFIGTLLLGANLLLINGDLLEITTFFLFIGATFSLAFYMVAVRQWALDPRLFFFAVPIVNATVMIPLWALLDGHITAPLSAIALQAGYQGIIVTIGAITLLTFAIRKIGSVAVSMIMAAVPLVTALLAFVILGEDITILHIVVLALCTCGIVLHLWKKRG